MTEEMSHYEKKLPSVKSRKRSYQKMIKEHKKSQVINLVVTYGCAEKEQIITWH